MYKYFLPYDVFERHRKVASFIKNTDEVLDIGGELNHLSQFCNPRKIVVANLNTGDVIITKDKIPFAKNSFDIVCSIDVLEHIPKNKRKEFVNNLVSIARAGVILSFPIGTKKHIYYEKKIQSYLKKRGEDVSYLNEHLLYGLPTKKEVETLTAEFNTKLSFSGNIKISELLLKIFMTDPKIKYLRKIVYLLKFMFNLATNEPLYIRLNNVKFSGTANRAYVEIIK